MFGHVPPWQNASTIGSVDMITPKTEEDNVQAGNIFGEEEELGLLA